MSQVLEVPQAVMLLFTRVRAEVELAQGHKNVEAYRVLTSMKAAILELERLLGRPGDAMSDVYEQLSHEQFEQVCQAYRDKFEELRTTLF